VLRIPDDVGPPELVVFDKAYGADDVNSGTAELGDVPKMEGEVGNAEEGDVRERGVAVDVHVLATD
jgi:hypothetical protein